MIEHKVEPLFSKVFFSSLLNLNDNEMNVIRNEIDEEYEKVNNGINDTTEITKSKKLLEKNNLIFLKNEILKHFYYFNEQYLKVENDFKITTSWATKSLKGQRSHFHNHSNCWYSGVFYVNIEDDMGSITFDTFADERFSLKKSEYNVYNSKEYTYKPIEKQMILFPSEVYHCINDNNTDKVRNSIAFNIIPVGDIGNKDSDSFLEIK